MRDMTISELHRELRAPEFHSYSVKYDGPSSDFNGDAAHVYTVTLGSSDKAQEILDLLVAILERELA